MDPQQKSHEYESQNAEPHMSSFISHPEPEEISHEEFEEELSPEERRDKTLSTTFALVGALAVIGAASYFISSRMQPPQIEYSNDRNLKSNLEIQKSDQQSANENDAETERGFQVTANTADADQQFFQSGIVQPTEDTFAKSDVDYSQSYVTTETVGQSASTEVSDLISREQSLSERVNIYELGISILKDPFWTQTIAKNSLLLKKVGPSGKDFITVRRFKGKYVTTQDSIYGSITYFFDSTNKVWMRLNHRGTVPVDVSEAKLFVPMVLTKQGKAILEGTTRHKTLIVALTVEDFLIINITGTGYTEILSSFVDEIRKVN